MSVYDERYEVHYGHASYYTSDPKEVLRVIDKQPEGTPNVWVNEGYGEWRDTDREGVTMVTRRTIGPVLISTLRYQVERRKVQEMLG